LTQPRPVKASTGFLARITRLVKLIRKFDFSYQLAAIGNNAATQIDEQSANKAAPILQAKSILGIRFS
jgi:hypothetical protein